MKKYNLQELFRNKKFVTILLIILILFCSLIINIVLYINKTTLEVEINQLAELSQAIQDSKTSKDNDLAEKQKELKKLYDDLTQRTYKDQFSDFEKFDNLEEHINDMFETFNNQFGKQFEVNIVPKESKYMSFSNTYIINSKKFHYNIQVD